MKTILAKTLFIAFACCSVLCLSTGAIDGKILKDRIKGEGPVIEKKVDLGEISGLSLSTSADVYLTQGTNREVRITGQANIIDNLDLTNEASVLKIGSKLNVTKCEPVKIYITLESIDLIKISGSGDVQMVNHFSNLKDLAINISGSGDVEADLDGEKIVAGISGSGDMSLTGQADALNLTINGSGDISAKKFRVQEAKVSISGSGDAVVNVARSLEGRVSGSGDIGYLGDPSVDCHKTGSGSIYRIR